MVLMLPSAYVAKHPPNPPDAVSATLLTREIEGNDNIVKTHVKLLSKIALTRENSR